MVYYQKPNITAFIEENNADEVLEPYGFLKGTGVLISSMIGISNRTTKDLDVTTRGIDLNKKI